MSVYLILKSAVEQNKFIEYSKIEYEKDIARTYNVSMEEAQKISEKHTKNALENKEMKNEVLTIFDENTNTNIGAIWIGLNPSKLKVFIYQIIIEEKYRGKGYGKSSLQKLDEYCLERDYKSISLSVFGWNTVAHGLYQRSGYETLSISMKKILTN